MQTFVPYGDDFHRNADALDIRRLGKQRVEGLQILRCLSGLSTGWRNHPIVKMWDGYEVALGAYVLAMCHKWTSYGYKDTCKDKTLEIVPLINSELAVIPEWLYDGEVKMSHKSNLIRKLPDYYGPMWPGVPDNLPYKWVV